MTTAISSKRKVLLLRLSSLGDVVLSTAAIAPFADAGWEVHMVTKAAFAPVLENDPRIRSVYRFDPRAHGGEKQARENFFGWCAAEKFDLVLDLHDSLRTRFWRCRLRRLAKVAVARKERLREILILVLRLGRWVGFGAGGRAKKMRDAAVNALRSFDSSASDREEIKIIAPILASEKGSLLPKSEFFVFLPGSAWEGKKWPYFAELAERAAALAPVVVLGGDGDPECEEIAARAKKVNAASLSLRGKTSMSESTAVIARAAVVVGNDTGMAHVAEALGKPLVVIEGPTSPELGFTVAGPKSRVVSMNLACRPCSKSGNICWRFGTRKCLYGLGPDSVFQAISEEWRKRAPHL